MNLTVNRLLAAIFLSILVHMLGLWFYEQFAYVERNRAKNQKNLDNLKVETLSLADLQKDHIKRQVIQLDKLEDKNKKIKKPDKAKYLAERNSIAEKEQINNNFKNNLNKNLEFRNQNKNKSRNNIKPKKLVNLFPKINFNNFVNNQAASGFSRDYVKDVEQGAKTVLNAWKWQHASFFNRIKDAVSREWNPNGQIQKYDPQAKLLGSQMRMTQVLVVLDKEGMLVNVKVVKKSGVYYLDDEAVAAFIKAEPFHNPPKELFEGREEFSFKFGFYFDASRAGGIDFNWRPY